MILSWEVQSTEGAVAHPLIAGTEAMIPNSPWPFWVSDGWDAYGEVLYHRHAVWVSFPPTGKAGRPEEPKRLPHPLLRYGQVVKVRNRYHQVIDVRPRMVYGKAVSSEISTWCLERQNLNFRHENRRLTRKTLAFSKSIEGLRNQLAFYHGYFNFVRPHGGLRVASQQPGRKWQARTPAQAAGICDRPWSMKELMNYKIPLN